MRKEKGDHPFQGQGSSSPPLPPVKKRPNYVYMLKDSDRVRLKG